MNRRVASRCQFDDWNTQFDEQHFRQCRIVGSLSTLESEHTRIVLWLCSFAYFWQAFPYSLVILWKTFVDDLDEHDEESGVDFGVGAGVPVELRHS
jgi:hypothetical protein